MAPIEELPDWERLLAAERHLQYLVPGRVLVGGTAAALHARHRLSIDGDHVLSDLRERFVEASEHGACDVRRAIGAEVLAAVSEVAGSDVLPVHFAGVPITSRSANSVTESAFVQSPTHPPRKVFSSWSRRSASSR